MFAPTGHGMTRRVLALLFFLMPLCGLATTHRFDTRFEPGQHSVLVAFQCDDRVDSQFVNIAVEKGISICFAPYANTVTDINGDFDGAPMGEPYYDEWCIGWARGLGMEFAVHDQPAAPALVDAWGRDSLRSRWAMQTEFVTRHGGLLPGETPGFVWVGHQNRTELRAMAREYGFAWTRGNLARNEDLYLNGTGWGNPAGGAAFCPPVMYHKSLVPSCSMYRLNSLGSAFPHGSTVADTTGWWAGVHAFLDDLSSRSGVAFLNIHPGYTNPRRETVSRDSAFARDLVLPNGNRIHFRGRQGEPGRNDVSALQLDLVLEAMAHWDSLQLARDGVRRLAIVANNALMADPRIPWRTDDTADPDLALAHAWSTADSLADPYFRFDGDPALVPVDRFPVYIDGTGTVRAGTGTAEFPLPAGAFNHLFNCTVRFTGHQPGDTLVLPPDPTLRCGNVVFDLDGLVLRAGSPTLPLMEYMSSAAQARYLRSVEWRNGVFDMGGNTTTAGLVLGDVASIPNTVLRPSGLRFRGIRFVNGADLLWLRNVHQAALDSCFFECLPGIAGSSHVRGGSGLFAPRLRNCVFDLRGAGPGSTCLDFAHSATDTWEDSLVAVNNILVTGTGAHTVIRIPSHANLDSTGVGRRLRLGGGYVVNNRADGSSLLVGGSTASSLGDLAASVARNQPGFTWPAPFLTGPWIGFDPLEDSSDTLKYGGWTGPGSRQRGTTASIGPLLYFGDVPQLRIVRTEGGGLALEWDPVPDALSYRVYRSGSGPGWTLDHDQSGCTTTCEIGAAPDTANQVVLYHVRAVLPGPMSPAHGEDQGGNALPW